MRSDGGSMKKHGHRWINKRGPSRTYRAWASMLTRCRNSNCDAYPYYGGRGIKACPEWLRFEAFLKDMGEVPAGMTLERKDPDGDYCKENCCWLPRAKQNANKRNNRLITFEGETLHVEEWGRRTGLGDRLRHRLKKGWPEEKAITKPLRPTKPRSQWKKSVV
jgi:hypothetical protein